MQSVALEHRAALTAAGDRGTETADREIRKKPQAGQASPRLGSSHHHTETDPMSLTLPGATMLAAMLAAAPDTTADDDRRIVAALDVEYQAAVERNDADTMARILHPQFVLVLGDGRIETRERLLASARERWVLYERQVEDPGTQTVRVHGDTAIVTARLWLKGTRDGAPIERRLWFSDTYVRTPDGWRYLFGQASLPLPEAGSAPERKDGAAAQ